MAAERGRGGMGGSWPIVMVVAVIAGSALTPLVTSLGLAQLDRRDQPSARMWLISALVGGLAGAAAVGTAHRADIWELAPALATWGCALVAAAACDAVTQRIPTPLVRQATAATFTMLIIGLAVDGDWAGLMLSVVGSLAAGLTMLMCWRFAGAGFGDVRLAFLGGLGLGHATHRGLLLAFAMFTLITVSQAVITLLRGRSRKTAIPYGPALTVGFLVAAAI